MPPKGHSAAEELPVFCDDIYVLALNLGWGEKKKGEK